MATIRAYAPGKIILIGEHYVVYGAPGVAAAISPLNQIDLQAKPRTEKPASKTGKAGPKNSDASPALRYITSLGDLSIFLSSDANPDSMLINGPDALQPSAEVYRHALRSFPQLGKISIQAKVKKCWPLKGVGNSASLAAALSAGLLVAAGVKPTPSILAAYANGADALAHGGAPSGIDAAAVSHGGGVLYQKSFDKNTPSELTPFVIPTLAGWGWLLVDTLEKGEQKASTAQQIAKFAAAHGVKKKPAEMTDMERRALTLPYLEIYAQASKALQEGGMPSLGKAMTRCHQLLSSKNVSHPRIEQAVQTALDAGAAGAKLSGAGGTGGVVLVLLHQKKKNLVQRALEKKGLRCFEFKLAQQGAHAKKS